MRLAHQLQIVAQQADVQKPKVEFDTMCCRRKRRGTTIYQAEGLRAPSRQQRGPYRGAGGALRGRRDDSLLIVLLTFDVVHIALYAALHDMTWFASQMLGVHEIWSQ